MVHYSHFSSAETSQRKRLKSNRFGLERNFEDTEFSALFVLRFQSLHYNDQMKEGPQVDI